MKTRTSFVSNSSSSSFIVYGKKTYFDELDKDMTKDGHEVICVLDSQGISGDVEDFVFTVTPYRVKQLDKCGIGFRSRGHFIEVFKRWHNDDVVMDITEPLTGGRIMSITKDYSSPCTDADNDKDFRKWLEYKKQQ